MTRGIDIKGCRASPDAGRLLRHGTSGYSFLGSTPQELPEVPPHDQALDAQPEPQKQRRCITRDAIALVDPTSLESRLPSVAMTGRKGDGLAGTGTPAGPNMTAAGTRWGTGRGSKNASAFSAVLVGCPMGTAGVLYRGR
ncbi:hypothetical protein GCM10010278_86400 [Streptomyces melanogenes]|nr:hypothetical protein GCM10010278_86400 [Streptomyces melanogenes]